ncbi:hypothetical protein Tco_0988628 [Tanacetum coccineum]|uniref:Gag-Pol polyprotein n=1 Tax=Tanacetum coccineum TaxID=301880 RepID=A0ABQ5ERU5_9ASTR
MYHNNVRPIPLSINTKFLNCFQPEWNKYVTIVRHNQIGDVVSYDQLYDSLVQFEPHVQASKAKKAAKNHDPLALLAYSNASSSQSYANSSYSPQPYYITHPSSVVDYEDEYQGELQGDSQEDKLTIAMMMVELIYKPRMQVMVEMVTEIQGDRIGIKHLMQELGMMKAIRLPRVHDAKYFREQILLAIKDEAGSNLKDEENDFMLDNSYGDETLEELTVVVIMMARIQSANDNAASEPSYDAKAVSEVKASTRVHEQVNRVQRKTIIHTSDDDQIDSNIIFDDPYVENNGGTSEHDSTAHDEYRDIKMLAYNVQREAKNKKRLNNELKKKKQLLQKELDTFKDRLAKKAFKERENRYLEDICDLEEKLSSHDRIVYKIGLGYKNPERLKKAIAAQPKMYDGEMLHSTKLQQELIDEVQEMLNIFESMEQKVAEKSPKENVFHTLDY